MLVLTRKLGESIRIGENIELYVVGVSRGKVKLGVKAPQNVVVQRSEIRDRISSPIPTAMPVHALALARLETADEAPTFVGSMAGV
jgi:carbon storage regulator